MSIRVSNEFLKHFDQVCMHYQCSPDEVMLMKEAVRRDYENAKICYAEMVREINA